MTTVQVLKAFFSTPTRPLEVAELKGIPMKELHAMASDAARELGLRQKDTKGSAPEWVE